MDARKCVIIGGGLMGLSTAWHLLKDGHQDVTILDYLDPLASSRDKTKILRVDDMDPERMKLVMRTKNLWETNWWFRGFLHRTGRIVAYPPSQIYTLTGIDLARSSLGLPARKHESAKYLEEVFGSMPISQQLEVVYNEDDEVIDLDRAMESMKQLCREKGARFHYGRALRLDSNGEGKIDTVVTGDESIDATETDVVLATEPWIMQLLEASHIRQPPLPRAPIATGVFAISVALTTKQWIKYHDLPRLCEIGVCEFVCHPRDLSTGKLTVTKAFKCSSGDGAISEPKDMVGTDLAIKTMLDARDWARERVPGLKGARIRSIRSYWDGITGDGKPIITRHPECANLIIAGGGSDTHAEDLLSIGQVVTEVLHGTESHCQFGWEESSAGAQLDHQAALHTDLLFEDLELEASRDQRVMDWKRNPDWII